MHQTSSLLRRTGLAKEDPPQAGRLRPASSDPASPSSLDQDLQRRRRRSAGVLGFFAGALLAVLVSAERRPEAPDAAAPATPSAPSTNAVDSPGARAALAAPPGPASTGSIRAGRVLELGVVEIPRRAMDDRERAIARDEAVAVAAP